MKINYNIVVIGLLIVMLISLMGMWSSSTYTAKAGGEQKTAYLGKEIVTNGYAGSDYYFGGIVKDSNGLYTMTIVVIQGWNDGRGGANIFVHVTEGQILHLSDKQIEIIDFNDNGDYLTFRER